MKYFYSVDVPQRIIANRYLGQPVYTLNLCVEETGEEEYPYRYFSITLPVNTFDKNDIISGLVMSKYSANEMDAIRNNYDLVRDGTAGDKTQEYTQEYLAMQEWRREAKEIASKIMEEHERN